VAINWYVCIIRLHRSTTYVDVAYCYRPSSMVCRSVCLYFTLVSPAKTAEAIEMPFGLRTLVGPVKHVLGGGPLVLSDIAMATNLLYVKYNN